MRSTKKTQLAKSIVQRLLSACSELYKDVIITKVFPCLLNILSCRLGSLTGVLVG